MNKQRNYPLWFAELAAIILLLNGCIAAAPFPLLTIQTSVSLQDLFLETDDLPRLANGVEWHSASPHDQLDKWAEMNAIAAMDLWFTYGQTPIAGLRHTIVQFSHAEAAESTWNETRNHAIERQRAGVPVQFLYMEELPSLHADNVTFRCEEYASSATTPAYVNCVARMQYDVFYVELQTRLSEDTLARSQFYELMQAADERMRPVWSANSLSIAASPASESSVRITSTVIPSTTEPVPTPSTTATVPSSPTVRERWQGLPLGPAGTIKTDGEKDLIFVHGPYSMTKARDFYHNTLINEGWTLFEELWSPGNRYGGESFYLLFWRLVEPESRVEAACVHGLTNPADDGTTFVWLGNCVTVRIIAEDTLTEPWGNPRTVEWTEWQNEQFTLSIPTGWQEDPDLFSLPICQPGSGVECLVSFAHETPSIFGIFGIASKKRTPEQSLIELFDQHLQDEIKASTGQIPVIIQQVWLADGREAIQQITLTSLGEIMGIAWSIHTITDTSHIIIVGTLYGKDDRVFAVLPLLAAMARSVQIVE